MNIKEVLNATIEYFQRYKVPNPRLDAEVLLSDLLGMERIKLYVNYDLPLKEDELASFRNLIRRRAKRVPVAYLTGHREFMSLDFQVTENVLIPRPETELLVEEVIKYCGEQELKEPNIVDVGTGSGAIAVSLGYYLEGAKVLGIDISEEALEVARNNIKSHNLSERVKVVQGDLLKPLIRLNKDNVDVVISNPPYISSEEMEDLPPEVKQEPALALDGGKRGLLFYEKILPQAAEVMKPGGLLALEIGNNQAESIKKMSGPLWKEINLVKDYAGHDRVLIIKKSGG